MAAQQYVAAKQEVESTKHYVQQRMEGVKQHVAHAQHAANQQQVQPPPQDPVGALRTFRTLGELD